MSGLTDRIRAAQERDIPALRQLIDEAECVIRDLEAGIQATPVDTDRVVGPDGPLITADNRAPLSPLPSPPRRIWDTWRLRSAWDAFRDKLLDHLEREERAVYPLALKVLEGRMEHRRHLSTPVVQMIAENEELRVLVPGLRKVLVGYDPVIRQVQRVIQAYERHARSEEIEVFPGLLQLADGNFNVTATPLHTRHTAGTEVTRKLRRSLRPQPTTVMDKLKDWWKR